MERSPRTTVEINRSPHYSARKMDRSIHRLDSGTPLILPRWALKARERRMAGRLHKRCDEE